MCAGKMYFTWANSALKWPKYQKLKYENMMKEKIYAVGSNSTSKRLCSHCVISWAKSFEKRRWPIQKMVHGPNSTKGTKPWRMLMCKYTWGEHTCQHHPQRNWNFIVEYRFLLFFWFSLNTKFGYRKNGFLRAVFFSLQQEEKKNLYYSTDYSKGISKRGVLKIY